jgi:hypothetical protein
MEFKHAKLLISRESKKRVFGGQYSDSAGEKFSHFRLFFAISVVTFFTAPILAAIFKKRRFHPYVYSVGSTQEIPRDDVDKALSRGKYSLESSETPQIFIKTTLNNFILFTDKNVYYELLNNSKILNIKTTFGKIPLAQARDIKFKNSLTSADIMMGDEVLGTLQDGESTRINRLLKEVAKDVRENANG